MRRNLFRKNAMLKMLSPLDLDRTFTIIPKRSWIALLSIALLVILVLLWCFYGKVYERKTGSGIILVQDGITTVYSPSDGKLIDLNVEQGDFVRRGDLIGTILLSNDRQEIALLMSKIRATQDWLKSVREFNTDIDAKNLGYMQVLERNLNNAIDTLSKQIEWHDNFINNIVAANAESIVSKKDLYTLKENNDKRAIELESHMNELENAKRNYLKQQQDISREELTLQMELLDLTAQLHEKVNAYKANSEIISNTTGNIVNIMVEENMVVGTNQSIINISNSSTTNNDEWILYAYYSLLDSNKIQIGMPVIVTPSIVRADKDGSITGVVNSVGKFVLPIESLNLHFRNQSFSQAIFKMCDNMPIEVQIVLNRNDQNFSGFEWTNGEGPQVMINEGSYCTASVSVETIKPIHLIFAKARQALLGQQINEDIMTEQVKKKLKE